MCVCVCLCVSLKIVEKPLVVLCVRSKLLKKQMVLWCVRSQMLKSTGFYCVWGGQKRGKNIKSNGFIVFSLIAVEKPMFSLLKSSNMLKKQWLCMLFSFKNGLENPLGDATGAGAIAAAIS